MEEVRVLRRLRSIVASGHFRKKLPGPRRQQKFVLILEIVEM